MHFLKSNKEQDGVANVIRHANIEFFTYEMRLGLGSNADTILGSKLVSRTC